MERHAGRGLHMRRGIRGDLSREDDGKQERAIFHDRHDFVVEVRVHHFLISFLFKRGRCAREAAIVGTIATGEREPVDCQEANEGPRCTVARLLSSLSR